MIGPEVTAVDLVHLLVLTHVGKLDVARNDVSIVHAGRPKHVTHVCHRHACLLRDAFGLCAGFRMLVDLSRDVKRLPNQHTGSVRFARLEGLWIDEPPVDLVLVPRKGARGRARQSLGLRPEGGRMSLWRNPGRKLMG